MYLQCVLTRIGEGAFEDWIHRVTVAGDSVLENAVGRVFDTMLQMVKAGESWTGLPPGTYGGTTRPIVASHLDEVEFAIRHAANGVVVPGRQSVPIKDGFFMGIRSHIPLTDLFEKLRADKRTAEGKEATHRKDVKLYAHETIALFESILGCSVAEKQRVSGQTQRSTMDTCTLGVIVATYKVLGKRGTNLDDLKHGYLSMDHFLRYQVWDETLPIYLKLKSASKGDAANGTRNDDIIIHHRCPLQCPIAMLGLYFIQQLLVDKDPLPSLDDWLSDKMHSRPLIRQQTGGGANVTAFNRFLKQDIALVGADERFTAYCFRSMGIAEAGEDPKMHRDNIAHGHGHSTGSHASNYDSIDAATGLTKAGYSGTDPCMMAAHVLALYQVRIRSHLPSPCAPVSPASVYARSMSMMRPRVAHWWTFCSVYTVRNCSNSRNRRRRTLLPLGSTCALGSTWSATAFSRGS